MTPRETLTRLREEAGLSQAEVARRLANASASRISRIESGELSLGAEDAEEIAAAIGESFPRAAEYAGYLRENWRVIARPAFNHASRPTLRKAELALQSLSDVETDPEARNAFLQQIRSCKHALEKAAAFLLATEHPIVFVGSPGVGKTTAICALSGLRNSEERELSRQMVLQTGAGRTTVCEVHVRNGNGYSITVDPCSEDELYQHVSEFCDYVLALATGRDGSDGHGISSEIERALRNMTELAERRIKEPDGKYRREDPAIALANQYPNRVDLQAQVRLRLQADRRNRTSISFPRDSTFAELEWLSKTFGEINFGKHIEFSLPRRIEVTVPGPILSSEELDVRLVDTRGVDEPSAPRRDLQAYMDDERALIVLCSGFKDAPDAAMQAVIERATEGGLGSSLVRRGMLLVLPQEGEEIAVRDNASGDSVSTPEEGREIRRQQVEMTLGHLSSQQLAVQFLNVRSQPDCAATESAILAHLARMRRRRESEIDSLVATVARLIENRANEEMRAVFQAATRPLRTWFAKNRELPSKNQRVESALLEEIDGIRYASTLRASVNRRGSWHNFDYWHGLGFGTRREAVARTAEQLVILRGFVKTSLADQDLSEVHGFLRHFLTQVETSAATFFQAAQSLGETAFFERLREDTGYWEQCRNRWGGGSGYKTDIRRWTDDWFELSASEERRQFIEQELQSRWSDMLGTLDEQLSAAEPAESAIAV